MEYNISIIKEETHDIIHLNEYEVSTRYNLFYFIGRKQRKFTKK